MKPLHLHLVVPAPTVVITETTRAADPWWEAPEFLALSEVRRAMVGGAVPGDLPRNAEESARQAVFWALYEIEHIVLAYAQLVRAGEPVRLRSGIYKHHERRVDFNLRIVEHDEVTITGGG